jgi:hypothetical protein
MSGRTLRCDGLPDPVNVSNFVDRERGKSDDSEEEEDALSLHLPGHEPLAARCSSAGEQLG